MIREHATNDVLAVSGNNKKAGLVPAFLLGISAVLCRIQPNTPPLAEFCLPFDRPLGRVSAEPQGLAVSETLSVRRERSRASGAFCGTVLQSTPKE